MLKRFRHKVVPASPDATLDSHDSAELLIPQPEPPSEAVPLAEEFAVDETLRVVLPTDGHLSGRRSWTEVWEVYGHVSKIFITIVMWNIAIYAGWSHAVVEVFCLNTIQNLDGSRTGFTRCVHVSDGNYTQDTADKIPFLVLWSALTSWQTGGFTMVLCVTMFGWDSWRRFEKIFVITSITCFTFIVMGGSVHYGWALDKPASTLAGPVSVGFINIALMGFVCARYSKNPVNQARWFWLFFAIGITTTFYGFVMPRLVTSRATPQQKLLVRLVIHPMIWAALTMLIRHVGRHIGMVPHLHQTVFLYYPYIYKSVFGRFLLLQLSKGTSVMALNYLICLLDVIGRLATRNADNLLLRLMYGRRTAQATLALQEITQWRMSELVARSVAEYTSIFGAASLLTFGRITPNAGQSVHITQVWTVAGVQAATYLVTDVMGLAIEMKYHAFGFYKIWNEPRIARKLIGVLLITNTFGSLSLCTQLLLFFCPRYYNDSRGVLLELCNQSNLFSHLRGWKLVGNGL